MGMNLTIVTICMNYVTIADRYLTGRYPRNRSERGNIDIAGLEKGEHVTW